VIHLVPAELWVASASGESTNVDDAAHTGVAYESSESGSGERPVADGDDGRQLACF